MAKKIVAGNWKMNLNLDEANSLVESLKNKDWSNEVEVILFPSHVLISSVVNVIKDKCSVGVQSFSQYEKGAYTGENSIAQVKSVGATIGLIGHSERRSIFGETNEQLKDKVDQAISNDFDFIFCCGEPLEVRESGNELSYVLNQLEQSLFHLSADDMKDVIIAYEPVWAIGTGRTASSDQAEAMHKSIRKSIELKYGVEVAKAVTILYGGSCNAGNASELFSKPNVDGGLIGGASLKAEDFMSIIDSF